ncbi:MAG: carboxymethylenebutenolidase [Pseudonocardiales bacterium]|nr:carboxymethylenebutenolidase [Pseudonocardiales bacterium]MDT7634031.1 carboxymethylenebutenolidase [Pseudonocardiales bacterium]
MVNTHIERVEAHDGGTFDSFCAVPDGGRGPGVLLFQEVFGVNDNMRGLAGRLADEGYLVLVPDMFWRVRPGFESPDEAGLAEGMSLAGQMDQDLAVHDMSSALGHLLGMPGCTGKVGAVGFCLGGTLTYTCAATARLDRRSLAAAVPYYGSGIYQLLDLAGAVECPIMFHYGDRDPYIPAEQVAAIEAAFAGHGNAEVHHYDAGHAFSNWDAPSFYQPDAAEKAWDRTTAFLAKHLR